MYFSAITSIIVLLITTNAMACKSRHKLNSLYQSKCKATASRLGQTSTKWTASGTSTSTTQASSDEGEETGTYPTLLSLVTSYLTTPTTSTTTTTTTTTEATTTTLPPCSQLPNTSDIIIEDGENQKLFLGSTVKGYCKCEDGLVKKFFSSAKTNFGTMERNETSTLISTSYILEVHVQVFCSGNFDGLCVCSESGECFKSVQEVSEYTDFKPKSRIGQAALKSYCDLGGCHMYFVFAPDSLSLNSRDLVVMEGDNGTQITLGKMFSESDCGGYCPVASDSAHIKAVSISCSGCASIRPPTQCFGPTMPYKLLKDYRPGKISLEKSEDEALELVFTIEQKLTIS